MKRFGLTSRTCRTSTWSSKWTATTSARHLFSMIQMLFPSNFPLKSSKKPCYFHNFPSNILKKTMVSGAAEERRPHHITQAADQPSKEEARHRHHAGDGRVARLFIACHKDKSLMSTIIIHTVIATRYSH